VNAGKDEVLEIILIEDLQAEDLALVPDLAQDLEIEEDLDHHVVLDPQEDHALQRSVQLPHPQRERAHPLGDLLHLSKNPDLVHVKC